MSKHILFINALAGISQTEVISLSSADWRLGFALTPEEGLSKAEFEQPNAIVLEGKVTDLDVIFLLHLLRLNSRTSAIPVVLLANESTPKIRESFLKLGLTGLIPQPWNPVTLMPAIQATLGWH